MMPSRRQFLRTAALTASATALPRFAAAVRLPGVSYAYAAITWGAATKQAIDDIASAGYAGIQFRANAVDDFTPEDVKARLAAKRLTFTALSSGTISIDKPAEPQLAQHVQNAKWAKAAGCLYLQILDELKGHPRTATPDECKRLGALLTELGKRVQDQGLPLGYHNHLNTLSEDPANLDRILDASDPRYVKLELDTGHLAAGGGDNVQYLRRYRDRLLFLHLKDVKPLPETPPKGQYPFQWVELGQGTVDFPAIFKTLEEIRFKGWAVVELDREPVPDRSYLESAKMSRDYLMR